jgi:hypothetical protein
VKVQHVIVIRLVDGLDGAWMALEAGRAPAAMWHNGIRVDMVATGDVEWDGDRPAEVYVPSNRLDEWRAEHPVDD